ncbi:hypothetical protein FOMPIDRAFT_61824 [Fomitopsis schrenkii]|uniref:Uncharacterized protein n=1 Tax=Fomitopsis schrenkii TaxID=2126942 RepID=S8DSE4_FOMSC|nr:hypothetical protein FOMPIDRAFT_61824 [Fomitopsis schrenkii]
MTEALANGSFASVLTRLRILLAPTNLPTALPLRTHADGKYGSFINFQLDQDLFERTESEPGTVNEQFKGIFGWKTRTTGSGIIPLIERSDGLLAFVDVLSRYHAKYPSDEVLMKWGYDILAAAEQVYRQHGLPVRRRLVFRSCPSSFV